MGYIYLLRHALTKANAEKRFCGWTKSAVLENELEKLKTLYRPKADAVLCSPMGRCIRTAQTLGYLNLQAMDSLKEINFGSWEMKDIEEIAKECPELANDYFDNPLTFRFPKGESIRDVKLRVSEFIKKEINPLIGSEKDIMIISHSGPLRIILLELLGLDLSFFWKFKIDSSSYTIIKYLKHEDKLYFVLESLNSAKPNKI